MRKRFINSAIAAAVALTAIAVPVGMADFGLVDYGVIEDSSVSDIQTGDNYTISFVEGSSSSSDTSNVASLPSQLVIAKDADFMPDMISSVPSKDGYAFTGYYLDSSMTEQLTFYEPLDSECNNVTVYVQFTPLSTYTDNKSNILNGSVTLSNYGVSDSSSATDTSGLIWKESNGGDQSYTSQDINLNVTDSEISNYVELKVYGNGYTEGSTTLTSAGFYVNAHTNWSRRNTTTIVYSNAHSFVLTLTQDLTIKSGGSLLVGGTTGTIGNGFLGSIDGDYFAIDLNGHTLTVEDGGSLTSHGILMDSTGRGMIEVESGGSLTINLTTSFNGGTLLFGAISTRRNPFTEYGFPLLRAKTRIHAGGNLTGVCGMGSTSFLKAYVEMSLPIVSSADSANESLFTLESRDEGQEAYLDFYNNMIPTGSTMQETADSWDDDYKGHLEFNNVSIVLDSLVLKISIIGFTQSFPTSDNLWSFPGSTDVVLSSSEIRIRQRFLLEPGISFYADQNSTVIFSPLSEEAGDDSDSIAGIIVGGEVVDALVDATVDTTASSNVIGHRLETLQRRGAAEATVLGDVKFENTTTENCFIGGNINLSDSALQSVLTAAYDNQVNLKGEGGLVDQKTGGTALQTDNTGVYYFYHLPLISNGIVYTNDNLDGTLRALNDDLNTGVYTDGEKSYAYIMDDYTRKNSIFYYTSTLKQVVYDDDTHTYSVVEDASSTKYIYFSGMFCPVTSQSENNSATVSTSPLLAELRDIDSCELVCSSTADRWAKN